MDVKRRNRIKTPRCLLSCGQISQMELSELGLVQEASSYASTGGCKAKAYAPVRE